METKRRRKGDKKSPSSAIPRIEHDNLHQLYSSLSAHFCYVVSSPERRKGCKSLVGTFYQGSTMDLPTYASKPLFHLTIKRYHVFSSNVSKGGTAFEYLEVLWSHKSVLRFLQWTCKLSTALREHCLSNVKGAQRFFSMKTSRFISLTTKQHPVAA